MFKKILLAVVMAIPFLASAQTLKIGVVNVDVVVAAMPEFETAQKTLAANDSTYGVQLQRMQEEYQRLGEEVRKMGESELPAIRERKVRDVQDLEQKITLFVQQAQQDMEKKQAELLQPITAKVRDAIESVSREGAFSMILSYNPQLILSYAAPVEDVTTKVKTKLGLK